MPAQAWGLLALPQANAPFSVCLASPSPRSAADVYGMLLLDAGLYSLLLWYLDKARACRASCACCEICVPCRACLPCLP